MFFVYFHFLILFYLFFLLSAAILVVKYSRLSLVFPTHITNRCAPKLLSNNLACQVRAKPVSEWTLWKLDYSRLANDSPAEVQLGPLVIHHRDQCFQVEGLPLVAVLANGQPAPLAIPRHIDR